MSTPLVVQAVEVTGLYEAELAVTSQGRTERKETVRSALLEVLIKASGNTQVALSPGVPQILSRSTQFLQQYRYRNEQKPVDAETNIAQTQQYLWVRFDKTALNTAMRNIGLAIWSRSRPSTLAWIVVEQQGQRQLLRSGEANAITKIILEQAKRRGIPLDLPLLDLEDQQRIGVTDVLGRFQEPILKASKRYSADAVLVGRLRQLSSQRWQMQWTLNVSGRENSWSEEGSLAAVINLGIDAVTSTLASNFVLVANNVATEVTVLVTGVSSLDDYARSEEFLAGLDGVLSVEPETIGNQRIHYKIKLRGDEKSLLQSVRLSSKAVLAAVDVIPDTSIPQPLNKVAVTRLLTFKLTK